MISRKSYDDAQSRLEGEKYCTCDVGEVTAVMIDRGYFPHQRYALWNAKEDRFVCIVCDLENVLFDYDCYYVGLNITYDELILNLVHEK